MAEFKYEIIERIAILSGTGEWTKELNKISWNDRPVKYDLRDWNQEKNRMGKGNPGSRRHLFFKNLFFALSRFLQSKDARQARIEESPRTQGDARFARSALKIECKCRRDGGGTYFHKRRCASGS